MWMAGRGKGDGLSFHLLPVASVKRMTHPLSIMAGTCRELQRSIAAELKLREINICLNSSLLVLMERKRLTGFF